MAANLRNFSEAYADSLVGRMGINILVCPKCNKVVREVPVLITHLNAWAYHLNEVGEIVCVDFDGRGCCY